jgi:hypothetical protein
LYIRHIVAKSLDAWLLARALAIPKLLPDGIAAEPDDLEMANSDQLLVKEREYTSAGRKRDCLKH